MESGAELRLAALRGRHPPGRQPELAPRLVGARPVDCWELALPFDAGDLAPLAANSLKNHKKARAGAVAWLRAHTETAITALLPAAFGTVREARGFASIT